MRAMELAWDSSLMMPMMMKAGQWLLMLLVRHRQGRQVCRPLLRGSAQSTQVMHASGRFPCLVQLLDRSQCSQRAPGRRLRIKEFARAVDRRNKLSFARRLNITLQQTDQSVNGSIVVRNAEVDQLDSAMPCSFFQTVREEMTALTASGFETQRAKQASE